MPKMKFLWNAKKLCLQKCAFEVEFYPGNLNICIVCWHTIEHRLVLFGTWANAEFF